MSIDPQFVCLSMLVSGRYRGESQYFSAVDGLAYAIERENDPAGELPAIVEKSVAIFMNRKPS